MRLAARANEPISYIVYLQSGGTMHDTPHADPHALIPGAIVSASPPVPPPIPPFRDTPPSVVRRQPRAMPGASTAVASAAWHLPYRPSDANGTWLFSEDAVSAGLHAALPAAALATWRAVSRFKRRDVYGLPWWIREATIKHRLVVARVGRQTLADLLGAKRLATVSERTAYLRRLRWITTLRPEGSKKSIAYVLGYWPDGAGPDENGLFRGRPVYWADQFATALREHVNRDWDRRDLLDRGRERRWKVAADVAKQFVAEHMRAPAKEIVLSRQRAGVRPSSSSLVLGK